MKCNQIEFILNKLRPLYSKDPIEINFKTEFQLIVATILSAQCTDVRVNKVTGTFFDRLKEPADFLAISQNELEELIRSTGFFRMKAKNIRNAASMIISEFGGNIPDTMTELVKLPGFGRKTANVILTTLFHKNEGVCVDTHVLRLAQLLGLSKEKGAIKVERDLMKLTPQENWHEISHFLVLHGRRVCKARVTLCSECVLQEKCPSREIK